MADNFSTAKLGLGVDTKQFNKELGNTSTKVEKALEKMKLSADAFSERWGSLTAGIKDTKRIVSGILISQSFYALSNTLITAGSAALTFSRNMETAAISMEYFVKGADKAAKAAAYLRTVNAFAARTPFSTEEVLSLSKYMQAVGVSMNTTKSFLSVITDTAAATGATQENLQRIVFGLGQMMTKGRLANEEIRQLANANIPIYEILQEELGLTGAQIANIGRSWVSADKAVVAILSGLERRYAGAADKISNTVTGMTDTILDNSKIIAQIAGSGVYDSLADKMERLRDILDRYRETVTTQGSMGLFNQILLDIDSSGAIGTQLLALVGNTRQLGAALKDLYITAQPLINLFSKSMYASLTVVITTLTSLARVTEGLVTGLNKLDITGGRAAEVISSLFIAYKAAKWMSLLGQGAAAAAYSMYQAVSAASALLPASLRASTGIKLLSTGILGLITYGLTAWGVFSMLNKTLAGLDTSKSDELFPDDYASAFSKYQAEMDEYNKQIAQYTAAYEQSYTTIADSAQGAANSFSDITEASAKAAKAVKNDWTAAFDEVYTIPDQDSALEELKDIGTLLTMPSFSFPDLSDLTAALKPPEFPWNDVYSGSWTDSDVLKGDWWKSILPIAIGASALQFAKVFAGARKKQDGGKGPSGGGGTSAFQSVKEATDALKNMVGQLSEMEDSIKELGSKIKEGKFKPEEENSLRKLLDERLSEANRLLGKIQRQATIAGKPEPYSAVLDEFNNLSELYKISQNVARLTELQKAAIETTPQGEIARKEIADIKRLLEKQYATAVARDSSIIPELDSLLKDIINTKGLEGKVEYLTQEVTTLRKKLIDNSFHALDFEQEISRLNKLGSNVLDELKAIGADTSSVKPAVDAVTDMYKLLRQQTDLLESNEMIVRLKEALELSKASGLSGYDVSSLTTDINKLKQAVQNLDKSITTQTLLIRNSSPEEVAALRIKQAIIEANDSFKLTTEHVLGRYLPGVLQPLKILETYSEKLVLGQIQGHKLIEAGIARTESLAKALNTSKEAGLQKVISDLNKSYIEMLKTRTAGTSLATFEQELISAVRQLGVDLGAENSVIEAYLDKLLVNIKTISGTSKELDYAVKQIREADKQRRLQEKQNIAADPRSIVDILDDKLTPLQETALTLKEYDAGAKRVANYLEKQFPNEFAQLREEIQQQFKETRAMAEERINANSALQKLANSELYKITTNTQNSRALLALFNDIQGLTRTQIGPSTAKGWAFLPESSDAPWVNNIAAGNIDADIVKANIFSPDRLALSGGDMAGMFGQSGYGVNVFSALTSNMTEVARQLYGIAMELPTIRTIANMTFGQVFELPILLSANKLLLERGIELMHGATFLTQDKTLQAQLDALALKGSRFYAPIDAKALFNFQEKIRPLLTKTAKYTDGIYKINAAGFKDVLRAYDDVAWQAAVQAVVTGTNKAMLAILDMKSAGMTGPDMLRLYDYSPTSPTDVAAVRKIAERQAISQAMRHLGKIEKNVYILELTIPKQIQEIVKLTGQQFIEAQRIVSQLALNGGDIKALLTPINMMGTKIGELSAARYDSFTPPHTGDVALDTLLKEITNQLKAISPVLNSMGETRLRGIIEGLQDQIRLGGNSLETQIVRLGHLNTGEIVKARITGEQMLKLIPALEDFQASFEGFASAATTQLSDLVKQMNRAADSNLRLEDVLRTNKSGRDFTVNDLAFQIMDTDKKLNGPTGSIISEQIKTMLSGKNALPVTNPYGFADLGTYLGTLSGNLGPFTGADDQLKLGNSIYIVKNAEDLAREFSSTKWHSFSAAAGDFSSNSGIYKTLNSLFGGKINFGKYAAYTGNASAAEAGAAPSQTGVYANAGKTTRFVSSTQLTQAAKVLGVIGIVTSIGEQMKVSSDILKTFNETILPTIPETERDAAIERSRGFATAGSDSGVLAGKSARAFLDQYADMTEQEKAYWSSLMSSRKAATNMLGGTDYAVLADALKYGLKTRGSLLDPSRSTKGMSKEQKLITALEEGVGKNDLATVIDFVMKYGEADSKISKEFYKQYGDYMDTIIRPAYGMDKEWYTAVNGIITASKENTIFTKAMQEAGLAGLTAEQIPLKFKDFFDSLLTQLQDSVEAQILPTLKAQKEYSTSATNPFEDTYAKILAADTSTLTDTIRGQLHNILGLSFESLADGPTAFSIDSDALYDNLSGWIARLPDSISLDGTTISTQDATILAQAGIQINGDGTITFMKALNENSTGTTRDTTLTMQDMSTRILEQLAGSGIVFNGDSSFFNLDTENISKQMQSALFALNENLSGQVSEAAKTTLAGLGEILESGYFEITNTAVLSGEMTITEYIKSLGDAAKELSPEIIVALENIDNVIAQGGEATRQTVAEWSDGLTIKSPINKEQLTAEIETAFAAIGISFEERGGELLMVINRIGEQLSSGATLIPADTWNKLNSKVVEALDALGVTMEEKAGFVMVDVSGVMNAGVADIISLFANRPDLWDQIPVAVVKSLEAAGIAVSDGMININLQALNGLVNLGTEWYGRWNQLPEDVKTSLDLAKLQTEDGLLKVEQVTENTKIPDNIDEYILRPFSELPAELQDMLTGGDASVKASLEDSSVLITGATENAFVGAITAVRNSFETMNSEADDGAQQLANTIAEAMANAQKLSNINVGASWIPFENEGKVSISGKPGNYTIRYGGNKYSGITAASEQEAVKMIEKLTGLDIPGYAAGGIIATDGLYRAGEFGKKEGIIPLENRASLRIIGTAIASQMYPTKPSDGLSTLVQAQFSSLVKTAVDANAVSIDRAAGSVSDRLDKLLIELGSDITDAATSITAGISSSTSILSSSLSSAMSSLSSVYSGALRSASSNALEQTIDTGNPLGMSPEDFSEYISNKWAAEELYGLTGEWDETLAAANQAIRDAYGIISDDYSYESLSKIRGSARGSMITRDGLYRAGEFGLNEAIVPLEKPDIMRRIGEAIYNSMPTELSDGLHAAIGRTNAGVSAYSAASQSSSQPFDMASTVDTIVQKVLENVMPAVAPGQEQPTPVYVGTLIADERGLKDLERKLYVIRQADQTRR